MSKIRLALIGCGGMAKRHVDRLNMVKDRTQLVAAVDRDLAKAKAVAELAPGCRAASNYLDVLGDCEAALVVLPHHYHYIVGMDLLNAGKHVLMEKPLANSELEGLDLIRTARKVDKTLMVAYIQRYNPMVVKMKELVEAKVYGEMYQFSIWTEQYTKYEGEDTWAHKAVTLGGGQLYSHGCHYVDLMLWFMGRPVEGTHMGTRNGTEWIEQEGTSHLNVRFDNGALGYHYGSWGSRGTRLHYTMHAHCEKGLIDLDAHRGVVSGRIGEKEEIFCTGEKDMAKPTEMEMKHFIDCIEQKKAPDTDGPTSLQGLRVIWRTYEAEKQKTVADLRGLGFDQVDEFGQIKAFPR